MFGGASATRCQERILIGLRGERLVRALRIPQVRCSSNVDRWCLIGLIFGYLGQFVNHSGQIAAACRDRGLAALRETGRPAVHLAPGGLGAMSLPVRSGEGLLRCADVPQMATYRSAVGLPATSVAGRCPPGHSSARALRRAGVRPGRRPVRVAGLVGVGAGRR